MIFEGKMVHKRLFGGEDSYEVGCKHPRQGEHINLLNSVVDIGSCSGAPRELRIPDGEVEDGSIKYQGGRRVASDSDGGFLNSGNKEYLSSASSGISSFLWVNSSLVDDAKFETADFSSLFPEYFEPDHRLRAFIQPDGMYYVPIPEYPTQKLVPVGPDHQALVPEWGSQNSKNFSESLNEFNAHGFREELMGTCILPMPDPHPSAYNCYEGGRPRRGCSCLDQGSIECVRRHVKEERDQLRENLGPKIFEELGFSDMGEEVANKWSEVEEITFNDIVLSNPKSLGKNFWDHLPLAFPSRTRKDMVSYYFNVYMLRKRAKQNRFDPLNIDSDGDEWQRSELGFTEEVEESGGKSQINEGHKVDCTGVAHVLETQHG